MHLSDATLSAISVRAEAPTYDRRALRPAIVHIGVGGFHRAHQAVYLDALARAGHRGWGEIGVGLHSARMKTALRPQDHLYTVVERDSHTESARVIGAMCDYLFAPDDPEALLERLSDPQTRMVTMTITGDGYNLDGAGAFKDTEAAVRADLARPWAPTTWFGFLVEGLARRRAAGLPGVTVLSCDNLPDSGTAARTAVVSFAALRDETLAGWVERNVTFPQSMVDRITPSSDGAVSRLVSQRFGIRDRAPVATEPFSHWVVEDSFADGRPPLEDVGVQVVSDVAPYKLMKTRLLNGTHTAMGFLGTLAGYRTTAEMAADPLMRAFLCHLMRDEIAPLLPPVPGVDLDEYIVTLLGRLSNASIADPLSRLCARGSTKMPSYLLPSLVEARQAGRPAPLTTLAVAAWFRYLRGTDLDGNHLDIQDPRADRLRRLAISGGSDPSRLLRERSVMGRIADDLVARRQIARALRDLEEHGPVAAVTSRLYGVAPAATPARMSPLLTSETSA